MKCNNVNNLYRVLREAEITLEANLTTMSIPYMSSTKTNCLIPMELLNTKINNEAEINDSSKRIKFSSIMIPSENSTWLKLFKWRKFNQYFSKFFSMVFNKTNAIYNRTIKIIGNPSLYGIRLLLLASLITLTYISCCHNTFEEMIPIISLTIMVTIPYIVCHNILFIYIGWKQNIWDEETIEIAYIFYYIMGCGMYLGLTASSIKLLPYSIILGLIFMAMLMLLISLEDRNSVV